MHLRPVRMLAPLAAVALFLGAAVPATAAPSTDPAKSAAGWLARQFTDGDHLVTASQGKSYPDPGLTADAVLALAAAKVGDRQASAATAWLAKNLGSYVGPGPGKPSTSGDKAGAAYAGALAKTALVAQVRGLSPAAFGGRDLLTELTARESTSGRFTDDSSFGDYSNAITQSLAVLVQARAGRPPSAKAVGALTGLQCPDGGFRLNFPTPGESEPCVSDPDATGYAAQTLLSAGRLGPSAKALDYLVKVQQASGGFANAAPAGQPRVVNADTTGLAAAALAVGGRSAQATKARAFLTGLQQRSGTTAGAVAHAAGSFDPATAPRATSTAVLGLAGAGLSTLSAAGSSADVPGYAGPTAPTAPTAPTRPSTLGPVSPSASGPVTTSVAGGASPSSNGSGAPSTVGASSGSLSSSGAAPSSGVTASGPAAAGAPGSSGPSGGLIAGIVAAVVVLAGALWWFVRRRSAGR